MPAYDNSPFKPGLKLLIPGRNTYLLGSYAEDVSPSKFQVATVSITSNVATVTGTMIEGNIPAVGSLISIRGTQTGGFNVTNVALASVSFTGSTSAISVTFALTGSNVSTTADAGTAIIPQPEVGEACVNESSIACTPQNNETFLEMSPTLSAVVSFPSLPTTATVVLQGADFDQDSEYSTLGTVATVAAGAQTTAKLTRFTNVDSRFLRFNVSGVIGGTSPTIVARISG